MQKVADFAEQRNVDRNAVTQYIRRHSDEFEGHIQTQGKNLLFDEVAFEILDEKYPQPKPIQIIEGVPHEEHERVLNRLTEVQAQFSKAQEMMLEMKDRLSEKDAQLVQKNASVQLLEDKEKILNALVEGLKAEKAELQAEKESLHTKIDALNAELIEANRPKPLLERLFGKKRNEHDAL